jgi:hypothetical protein
VWQPQGAATGHIWYNGGNVGIGTANPARALEVTIPSDNWGMRLTATGNGSTDYSWHSIQTLGSIPFNINPLGGNVGIGTTTPQYKLAVDGAIGARDIIVTNAPWSDYVLRPDYRLRPLREVDTFIRQHGHLPGIPSEAEVKANGVSVAEMQAKLLAKIEELTLHLIRHEADNARLQTLLSTRNERLEARIAELESFIAAQAGESK